jgi:hypothetical protein
VTTASPARTGTICEPKAPRSTAAAASARPGRVLVEVSAGEAPALRDELRALPLVEREVVVARQHPRPEREPGRPRGAQRDTAHDLDAAGDHDVVLPGQDLLDGELKGLLAGAAGTVDRRAGDRLRPAGREHGVPPDVARLVTDLAHASPDHVVDDRRVDPGPRRERGQHVGGQVHRVRLRQRPAALPDGGADRLDDDRLARHQ